MGASKCLSRATQKTFEKIFAPPGNSAALGCSFESLCGKSGPGNPSRTIAANQLREQILGAKWRTGRRIYSAVLKVLLFYIFLFLISHAEPNATPRLL